MKEGGFKEYYEPSRSYFSSTSNSWIFAPYMADLSLGPNSVIRYSVYSKYTYEGEKTSVSEKLREIDNLIKIQSPNFASIWATVITWENVRSHTLEGESWVSIIIIIIMTSEFAAHCVSLR